jgi:lipoyl(octanoyl) transferase
MMNLNTRGKDVRKYVWKLEEWVIRTLATFNIVGERRTDRVGVWVVRHDKPLNALGTHPEDKIAAIGVRLRKWVSFHGVSINLNPDLEHYSAIVPCGIAEHGVTSFADLSLDVSMDQLDAALREQFEIVFESNIDAPSAR